MIYLDYAATTPCLPEVVDAMLPYLRTKFGNAASIDHSFGGSAKAAVEMAREQVANMVGAQPEDVIFTSGSTEANNLVLNNELRLITGQIEHPSIRDTAQAASRGVDWLSPGTDGVYSRDQLADLLGVKEQNTLVSVMAVNNEIGSRQPLEHFARTAKDYGAMIHSDATQAVANTNMTMGGLDAISLSAHKLYGPKGAGALICRPALRRHLKPTLYGGGHERGLRSGTLNVPGIVGFGVAAAIAKRDSAVRARKIDQLRAEFITKLRNGYSGRLTVNAESAAAPHISSLTIHGINARALLVALRADVCFSLGSACATNKNEPSYVLLQIGLSDREANETIRCSFSHELTMSDVSSAATIISERATRLLDFSAV